MAILFSLLSALLYGTSDFIGGVLTTRLRPWTAAFTGQASGGVLLAVIAAIAGSELTWSTAGWGALAGVGGGLGIVCLYRGLATGRMGVVAPLSGVVAAILPTAVGVAGGDRPAVISWIGIVLALPATWLVASAGGGGAEANDRAGMRGAVLDGLLAGAGFGVSFAAVAQTPAEAGQWPVATELLVGAAVTVLAATLAREAWVPRTRTALLAPSTGFLAAGAMSAFLAATHRGMLAITGIISSLYPAATVVLAIVVLRERVHRSQGVGLALCAVAVGLVAGG